MQCFRPHLEPIVREIGNVDRALRDESGNRLRALIGQFL